MSPDPVAIAGFVIAVASLWLALVTLRRGNKNASAALVVTIHENFRQAWHRVRTSSGTTRNIELHELLNLIETTCAIQHERSITGVSRELIEDYLCEILHIIGRDLPARQAIARMRNSPKTFKYLRAFFAEMRRAGRALPLEKVATGEVAAEALPPSPPVVAPMTTPVQAAQTSVPPPAPAPKSARVPAKPKVAKKAVKKGAAKARAKRPASGNV